MPSNSNGSPANTSAATTAQNGARSSATGHRTSATQGIPTVIIPPGSRLADHQTTYSDLPTGSIAAMPAQDATRDSTNHDLPASLSLRSPGGALAETELTSSTSQGAAPATTSSANMHRGSSVSGIHAPDAMPASEGASGLVNRALQSADRVGAKASLPAFARDYITTSVPSLVAILAQRSFVGMHNPNLAEPKPIVVIPEATLRALFMKGLLWFVNRECAPVDGAVVVFVGEGVRGHTVNRQLALPLAAVRKLASEFTAAEGNQSFDTEFEEFGSGLFPAGNFYIEQSGWALPIAGIVAIIGLSTLVLVSAFVRDVVVLLVLLPHGL